MVKKATNNEPTLAKATETALNQSFTDLLQICVDSGLMIGDAEDIFSSVSSTKVKAVRQLPPDEKRCVALCGKDSHQCLSYKQNKEGGNPDFCGLHNRNPPKDADDAEKSEAIICSAVTTATATKESKPCTHKGKEEFPEGSGEWFCGTHIRKLKSEAEKAEKEASEEAEIEAEEAEAESEAEDEVEEVKPKKSKAKKVTKAPVAPKKKVSKPKKAHPPASH